MQRRTFLTATAVSSASVLGANDRVRGAVIGSGGRGRFLTAQFKEIGVEMAAVCDVVISFKLAVPPELRQPLSPLRQQPDGERLRDRQPPLRESPR